ncbi:Monoterpene synthase 25 [Psilocybe cubensis]|uniref:Terpene synthase n=2 Tax=Psilocybe cubensis TaxID=181762 RepID=A0A8H8CIS7_PSICU|nr:Monoterpene synthase 25 [Psilocybe cubensis]KAH9478373.1 Monoterpene synthase 25 [Psilocybe cubensis]
MTTIPRLEFHQDKILADIKMVCADFITKIGYSPLSSIGEDNVTYNTILSEFASFNMEEKLFRKICLEASTIAELCYSGTSAEVRVFIARYSWYFLYIDDYCQRHTDRLATFQQGVFSYMIAEDKVLNDLRRCLADAYRLWDDIPANGITVSGLESVNGCLIEKLLCGMPISPDAGRWPDFLRLKTGAGHAYAYMIFPKELGVEVATYIQAVDDIALFICLTNDILSFYKEELAGETANYIHLRATVTHKCPLDALKDTVKDTLDAHERILKVLANTPAYEPFKEFVNGSMGLHHVLSRYRLADLRL